MMWKAPLAFAVVFSIIFGNAEAPETVGANRILEHRP